MANIESGSCARHGVLYIMVLSDITAAQNIYNKYIYTIVKYYHTRSGRYQTPCQLQTSIARALMATIAPPSGLHRRVMILITIMQQKAYICTYKSYRSLTYVKRAVHDFKCHNF